MEGNIMLALDTFNKCSSFQEYADCAMALIGNPMIIFDMNMHVVACTNVETNDEKYNNMRQKQSPMSAIAENLEWRLEIKDLISNVKVTQTTIKGLDMLHKTMRVNGIIVGQLHSTAYFRPFREDDFRVMELISSRLALEMYQYLSLDQPCGNETDALLQYLLAGHTLNEDVLAVKTALIEWHPTQHLYILCRNKFVGIGQEDEALLMAIKEPEDKFLRFQRSMIVLLSRPKALTSDDFSKIEAVLKIKRGSVGISREFSSLNGTHKAYEEAVAAADIGSRVDGKNRIYSYDEFLPFVLIRKCAQAEDILKYVMPGLIELAAEDKRQGTEMMKTVRNYLKNGRSLRKVSEQLNIHKNTVTYRISKFSELLGIDLDDDDAPLRLGHSLQILEFVDKKRYF